MGVLGIYASGLVSVGSIHTMAFSPSGGGAYCAASHHQLQFPVVSFCFFICCHCCAASLSCFGTMSAVIGWSFSTSFQPAWISGRFDIQFCIGNSMWGISEVVTQVFEVPKLSHCVDLWLNPIWGRASCDRSLKWCSVNKSLNAFNNSCHLKGHKCVSLSVHEDMWTVWRAENRPDCQQFYVQSHNGQWKISSKKGKVSWTTEWVLSFCKAATKEINILSFCVSCCHPPPSFPSWHTDIWALIHHLFQEVFEEGCCRSYEEKHSWISGR